MPQLTRYLSVITSLKPVQSVILWATININYRMFLLGIFQLTTHTLTKWILLTHEKIYFLSNWWSWKKNPGSWPVLSILWTWIFLHVISSLGFVFCFFNLLAKVKAREWQITRFKMIINLIITVFSREIILMKVTLVFYVQSAVPEKCNWTAFSFKNKHMYLYLGFIIIANCLCDD